MVELVDTMDLENRMRLSRKINKVLEFGFKATQVDKVGDDEVPHAE